MYSITWITMFLFLDFVLTENKKYSGIYQDYHFDHNLAHYANLSDEYKIKIYSRDTLIFKIIDI